MRICRVIAFFRRAQYQISSGHYDLDWKQLCFEGTDKCDQNGKERDCDGDPILQIASAVKSVSNHDSKSDNREYKDPKKHGH